VIEQLQQMSQVRGTALESRDGTAVLGFAK